MTDMPNNGDVLLQAVSRSGNYKPKVDLVKCVSECLEKDPLLVLLRNA